MDQVPQAPIEWLLERDNPSVRARTLIELLDRDPGDTEVAVARQMLAESDDVASLLAGQCPDGHWGKPERYFDKHDGTAWRWLLLHEMGFDPMHPQMQRAARFLLESAFTEEKGAFSSHPGLNPVPCYNGWLLWGMHRSGLGEDLRVRRALHWVEETMRFDDGDHPTPDPDNGCYGRHTCYRGVVPLVRALAELPQECHTPGTMSTLDAGIEFMLLHHAYKKSHNLSKPMNAKLTQLTFPGFYWPDLTDVLLVLTRLGCRDARMCDAIGYLKRKQAKDGTWKLQRTYNERSKHDTFPTVVSLGDRGAPSKWVTLRALVVLKRWCNTKERAAEAPEPDL